MFTVDSVKDLTVLKYPVPNELAEKADEHVTAMLDDLLAGWTSPTGEWPFPVLEPAQARKLPKSWSLPKWLAEREHEQQRMVWAVTQLSGSTLQVAVELARNPQGCTTQHLADRVPDHDRDGIPSVFRAISAYCRRVERRPMWFWQKASNGQDGYATLDDNLEQLLTTALDEVHPGWREQAA